MSNNRCVCCNVIVPSGRQICWICEHKIMEDKDDDRKLERTKDEIPTKK